MFAPQSLLFLALLGLTALAQTAPSASSSDEVLQAERKLTNNKSREWTFKRILTSMGDKGCTEGEVWRFSKDKTLVVEQCEAGKLIQRQQAYTLASDERSDVILTVGADRYAVYFRDDPTATVLRLRKRAADKSGQTVDKEFRSRKNP